MVNYRDIFIKLGWRLALALLVIGVGALVISKGLAAGGGAGSMGYFIFGMSIFVVAAIIMGRPLASLFAEFLGNLIYTSEHYGKPQPVYGIPETKRMKGLYKEAFEGLQKITLEYPQESKAYIEMIDIAIMDLKDLNLAESVYHSGMEALEEEEARGTLTRVYNEAKSNVNSSHAGI